MKHVWGKVCAASVAAAGVTAFTPSASAENRPLEFETEFDLGVAPAASAIKAELATTAAAAWEQSIGSYLDRLVDVAKEVVTQPVAAAPDAVQAAVDAELTAFAAAAAKPLPPELLDVLGIEFTEEEQAEAPKISLAPYPSADAHDCELCRATGGQWIEVTRAEQPAAPAESLVDDAAAWEKLAEWASSRIEAAEPDDAPDAFSAFFGDSSLAD